MTMQCFSVGGHVHCRPYRAYPWGLWGLWGRAVVRAKISTPNGIRWPFSLASHYILVRSTPARLMIGPMYIFGTGFFKSDPNLARSSSWGF